MDRSARTEKVYTRVRAATERAFNVKCAELGINRPAGAEAAIEQWVSGTVADIDFTCRFCRAEYCIPPLNPKRAEVVSAPLAEPAGDHPQMQPESQWLVDEFIRMLEDPEEKFTLQFFSNYLAKRRKFRQPA